MPVTERMKKLLATIEDGFTAVSQGDIAHWSRQVGADAVSVKRVGLRGDAKPGIIIEIMPNTPVEERSAPKYKTLFTDTEEQAAENGNQG